MDTGTTELDIHMVPLTRIVSDTLFFTLHMDEVAQEINGRRQNYVIVMSLTGARLRVNVEFDITIAGLREKILDAWGIPADHGTLVWAGRTMDDPDLAFGPAGLTWGTSFTLNLRLRGD